MEAPDVEAEHFIIHRGTSRIDNFHVENSIDMQVLRLCCYLDGLEISSMVSSSGCTPM